MKIKLFSHSDLDGIGCVVVCKNAFDNVDYVICDYNDVNKKILDFLENDRPTDYDRIFITDISVNEEVAERLDLIHRGGVSYVQLVDHHATALWLDEKYSWAEVRVSESNLFPELEPEREKVESSGTTLFYKFLRNKNIPNIHQNPQLKAFAETVRKYDTWNWSTIYKDNHPKKLNDLLYIIGREKFVERFSKDPMPIFNELEETILSIEEHRVNKYIWYKKQEVKEIGWQVGGQQYKVAYVFAEQNVSLLGNAIAEQYGGLVDFVAIIDVGRNKVSLRSIHEFPHLGMDVAKHYGGGGHSKASGFEFSEGLQTLLFMKIIDKEEGIIETKPEQEDK